MFLSADDLRALTGYRQHARQLQWLATHLRISPPRRCDGLPVVSKVQVEEALAGKQHKALAGPAWSKVAT